MSGRRALTAVLPAAVAAIAVMIGALALMHGPAGAQVQTSDATISLMAIDAVTTGNTATTLGTIDDCVRAEVGAEVTVDVTVDAIPVERQLIGFQMALHYDADLLQATAVDKGLLLGAVGEYQPFEAFSDELPDSDGTLTMAMVDVASNSSPGANMESGPGVLARVTFVAQARGAGPITIDPGPNPALSIMDNSNRTIGIERLGAATVSVGEDCPALGPEAQITVLPSTTTPSPIPGMTATPAEQSPGAASPTGAVSSPTPAGSPAPGTGETGKPTTTNATGGAGDDDGDSDTGMIILAALLAGGGLAAAGGGGWLLYRRRGTGA